VRRGRKNPIQDNLLLIGVGVVALLAVGYAVWSQSSASSSSWPASQFTGGTPGNLPTVGGYVTLTDATSGATILVQVTSVSMTGATGTVYYAPPSAPESVGDTVAFNLYNVVASAGSASLLQAPA